MAQFEILLELARSEKMVILILTADNQTLIKNNDRPEYPEVIKNLLLINDQFKAFGDIYKIPIINVFKTSFEDIVKIIEKEREIA
jgi:hypothetical protein